LVAIIIATPLSWYAMNRWLGGSAYIVEVSWWIYPLAGILAIIIALLTISSQAIKAALMDPVKSLRSK
jgi:putative ABC transport system permease protein